MNFALDVFTEYSYEHAASMIQNIKANEILPTNEVKFLSLMNIFEEVKKKPS